MTPSRSADREPQVDDLSAFIMSGRVTSTTSADMKTAQTVQDGLQDAVLADQVGFRRVFLSERYNLKEAGAILGGVGALTSRVGLATGVLARRSRHPLLAAALGATLHAGYGPRFTLGLGRSDPSWIPGTGDKQVSYQELIDYAGIVRRLWDGETVTYDGPAGDYPGIALGDAYDGPPPEIWIGILGQPKGAEAAANPVFDGVVLYDMATPEATHAAVTRLRAACERRERDPATLRICQPVVTAPGLDDYATRALAHARLVTYLIWRDGQGIVRNNGWDQQVLRRLLAHPQLQGPNADLAFHREQLMGPASLIPDGWIADSCAVGSVEQCVASLQRFKDAGADEVATYGSTVAQNVELLRAWRARAPEREDAQ